MYSAQKDNFKVSEFTLTPGTVEDVYIDTVTVTNAQNNFDYYITSPNNKVVVEAVLYKDGGDGAFYIFLKKNNLSI